VKTVRLRVELRDVSPRVLRVVDVPAACTLPELHDLLQVAIGWTDSHLHEFVVGQERYGLPDPDGFLEQHDETGVGLRELGRQFDYHYDFGDGWEHTVEVLGSGADQPGCVFAEGACPPEDCGGPGGYEHLLAVLADPDHDGHEELRQWTGELPDVDQVRTDLLVRQTAGEVPASVRLVLELADGGVKLTPGGRLPRAFVRAVQDHRPQWAPLGRPAALEEDLLPLADLHDLLRDVGLLRLARGVLAPTRAAQDDLQVVRRLRSAFPPGGFRHVLVTTVVALLAAEGPIGPDDLADRALPRLGRGWHAGDRPIERTDVQRALWEHAHLMRGLDLIAGDWPVWTAGPSARTLLPRATALAQLWSAQPARDAAG
jgi:hypothetical protein